MSGTAATSPRRVPVAAIALGAVVGALFAVTLALWLHYGTAVFYEMLLAGFAACF